MSRHDPFRTPLIDTTNPVKVKMDFWRALAVIFSAGAFIVPTWFWLSADRHNDERYIQRSEYETSRRHAEELLSRDLSSIRETHVRQQAQLIDIAGDVKTIIRSLPTPRP